MSRQPAPATRWSERASSARSGTRIARWNRPVLKLGAGGASGADTSSITGSPPSGPRRARPPSSLDRVEADHALVEGREVVDVRHPQADLSDRCVRGDHVTASSASSSVRKKPKNDDLLSSYPRAQPIGLVDRSAAPGAGRGHVEADHHGAVLVVGRGPRLRAPVGKDAEHRVEPVAHALVAVVERPLRLGEQRAQHDLVVGHREDPVEVARHERVHGPPHELLGHQRKSPAYALSAGWPPRCAYSTFEPLSISPLLTRSIIPAIDFPS